MRTTTISSIKCTLIFIIILFSLGTYAQNIIFNRLHKLEQKRPNKLENTAKRYSKVLKNNPIPYYFLSKDQLTKFSKETEERKEYKAMSLAIKFAAKAQKFDNKREFNTREEWLEYREKIKHLGYFYFQENSHSNSNFELEKKFNLLMSFGESEFLSDQNLNLKFPKDEKSDTLFYGLPTGQEYIKPMFKEEEQIMLNLINEERVNLGQSAVVMDSTLSIACRYHAYDMATQGYTSHTGYDRGEDGKLYFANQTFERIRQFYDNSNVLSENISWGEKTAKVAYKGWFESSPHYKNLFNPANKRVGIGLVYIPNSEFGYYWVFNSAD